MIRYSTLALSRMRAKSQKVTRSPPQREIVKLPGRARPTLKDVCNVLIILTFTLNFNVLIGFVFFSYFRNCYLSMFFPIFLYQLHAISCTQQSKQRESRVKTLRSKVSAGFRKHCVLSGETQRRVLPRHRGEDMKL